jgi:hypothetical protein
MHKSYYTLAISSTRLTKALNKIYDKDKNKSLILIAIGSSRGTLISGDGKADYVIPN